MTAPILGCIADDYTGATDLSSMLVRAGLRVVQCFGTPDLDDLSDVDAIVVSLKSRSMPADDAVKMSLAALRFLQDLGVKHFFFKYCSTFDSTPEGNIGPVADALAAALDAGQVIFCPSFPENGRTVYCGNLFVGGVPLNESGMRNHPLNPMTDSSLVRVLQTQSSRPVRCLGLDQELSADGQQHLIADAITNEHLQRIAKLARDHRFMTGGSAIARYWAEEIVTATDAARHAPATKTTKSDSSRSIVLAGSCSDATRQQVAAFADSHPVYHLKLDSDNAKQEADAALAWCSQHSASAEPLLICSSAEESVHAARQRWGPQRAAKIVEETFAFIATALVDQGIRQIVVAGGETSGAVINALNIHAIRIGKEIAPGVPWVQSTKAPFLSLALKSGNFGGPRFFFDALECVE